MQCFSISCLVSLLWLIVGYSLAFGDGGPVIGGLGKAFLAGVGTDGSAGTIPETVFFMFQMTFAIITPALIVGAYPERMSFPAVLLLAALWLLLVYAPVCHWVWGGGWLAELGVKDFAGGIVVHTTAGRRRWAALVLGAAAVSRTRRSRRTACPELPGRRCCGSAGSASTAAARSPRTATPGWRCGDTHLGGGRRAHLGRDRMAASTANRAWSAR